MNDIILKINNLIEKKGITKAALAKMIHMTKQSLYDFLSGKTAISIENLRKISEVLNVPITYFFTDAQEVEQVKPISKTENNKENEQLRKEVETLNKKIIELQDELLQLHRKK